MLLPSIWNISLLLLGILSTFTPILNAYDLSRPLQAQGPLGVTLDYSLAMLWPEGVKPEDTSSPRHWAFSSHLVFREPVESITDGQLWKIARDAATEMEADLRQYGISAKRMPSAMGILAWDKHIILASSQTGQKSFTYDYKDTPVLQSLRLCQIAWRDEAPSGTDSEHRTQGKCAEQISAHMYYLLGWELPLQVQNARVGVWVRNGKGEWGQRDPCGDPRRDSWGCNLFTVDQKWQVLGSDIQEESYDLASLAGGIETRNQIQLCSSIREDSAPPL
ncbi:hypothetical protein ASPCAL05060 [Aspergillus calidoustus]|uniref:Uncharacterized protein n=1 Tax=Aspergillus calidoustus TaxID=454130 RepID=A0A0U5FX65_ASPCI|nr:hypothetical protein ASPCAL05060 [Aspergillus calidoustus]